MFVRNTVVEIIIRNNIKNNELPNILKLMECRTKRTEGEGNTRRRNVKT